MFTNILVPLDGSEYSERALALAAGLAKLGGGQVNLLTVILRYPEAHVPPVEKLDEQSKARAEAYLARHIETAKAAGVGAEGYVRHGVPSQEIVGLATEAGCDLIVMSTHGIGATGLHALGSVAMKVLETAPCPVLMVRIKPER